MLRALWQRRRGTLALACGACAIGGAALAWALDPHPAPRPAASLVSPQGGPAARAPSPPSADLVRRAFDPDRAVERQGRLVLPLPGGGRAVLTLSPTLQRWARRYLARYRVPYGCIALVDLEAGALSVLAGHAEGRPALGSRSLCLDAWAPAASVFKIVTAAALLARGVPPSATTCYRGGLRRVSREHLASRPGRGRRCDTLTLGVARSINPVLAALAHRHLDRPLLARWARRFGIGDLPSLPLPLDPGAAEIPDDPLARARVAAGFWHTEITALHGAMIAATVAQGGTLRWPRAVASAVDGAGRTIALPAPAARRVVPPRVARDLARAMRLTVTRGTGRRAFRPGRGRPDLHGLTVAGKTGSLSRRDIDLHYSWFVGFAPAGKPRWAVAALLGNPGRWRIKGADAARAMLARAEETRRRHRTRGLAGRPAPAGAAR